MRCECDGSEKRARHPRDSAVQVGHARFNLTAACYFDFSKRVRIRIREATYPCQGTACPQLRTLSQTSDKQERVLKSEKFYAVALALHT